MKKLILGATGSIGSSLARKLVKDGSEVHLAGRDEPSLSSLASELNCTFTTCDVLEENFSEKIKKSFIKLAYLMVFKFIRDNRCTKNVFLCDIFII